MAEVSNSSQIAEILDNSQNKVEDAVSLFNGMVGVSAGKGQIEAQTELLRPYQSFFVSTWEAGNYQLRVYIARKCSNMNELLFLRKYSEETDLEKRKQLWNIRQSFIFQNALFGYVDEIVDIYHNHGSFPSILIVDELVIYGRQISAFLRDFETAILQAWHEQEKTGKVERKAGWDIRHDFMKAVDIRAYARNSGPLLEERYCSRIRFDQVMSFAQQCKMVQDMSIAINESEDIENTSCTPFFRLEKSQYEKLFRTLEEQGWHKRTWTYHQLKADIWQKTGIASLNDTKLQGTLRVHFDESGTVRVIPLALFESISVYDLNIIAKSIAQYFEQTSPSTFRAIIRFLKNENCELLWTVKMQWVSFLISVVLFFNITELSGIEFRITQADDLSSVAYHNHDLEKMAQNFGCMSDTLSAIMSLCASDEAAKRTRRVLWGILYPALKESLSPLRNPDKNRGTLCEEAAIYIEEAEHFLNITGKRDEKRLAEMQRKGLTYGSRVRSDIFASLGEYLNYFSEGKETLYPYSYNLENCIGVLLMMVDQGITGMVINEGGLTEKKAGRKMISNWIRAGEQSLYVEARKYYRFYPALINIEARCLKVGRSVLKQVTRFGRMLDRKEPGQHLEQGFRDLYTQLHSQERDLRDWSFDMLEDLDRPVQAGNNSIRPRQEWCDRDWGDEWRQFLLQDQRQYYQYECNKQEYYLRLSRQFQFL